jgi:hypothetical protein
MRRLFRRGVQRLEKALLVEAPTQVELPDQKHQKVEHRECPGNNCQ